MRCMILCGGKGERLMPLTKDIKKAFLPLGEKRVVDHIIDRLPVGMHYTISLNDDGAIAALAEVAKGDEPIMVTCGDNYFSCSLDSFTVTFNGETLIGVHEVKSKEMAKQCGVVEFYLGDRQLKSLIEKPERPQTKLVSAGLYIFPPHVFDRIHKLAEVIPKGNLGIVINHIMTDRPVYGFLIQGMWVDIGTPEGYNSAVRLENDNHLKELTPIRTAHTYQLTS